MEWSKNKPPCQREPDKEHQRTYEETEHIREGIFQREQQQLQNGHAT